MSGSSITLAEARKPSQGFLAPLLVGLVAFLVYRATLAPGLTWAHTGTDGGDLVTAAMVWGVPHPPGYPTYTFLGHLFSRLPLGSVAFNLNVMSAVCAALAAALIAASVLRGAETLRRSAAQGDKTKLRDSFAAVIAGLTLGFGPMLWGQAIIAEVHALNALFVSAICFLAPPWVVELRVSGPIEKIALGLVWGVSLGNTPTMVALAPIVLPAVWRGARGRWIGFAALLAGLSVYALIPIRAATLPPISWFDARSLQNFVRLVSGELYRGYVFAAPSDLVFQRILGLPRLWLEQVGWVGAIWIAWGVVALFRWKRIAPVTLCAVMYVVFAIGYNTIDSDLYLIPVWVLSAGYLGVGLIAALDSHRVGRGLIGAAAALGALVMLVGNWRALDVSRERSATDFAERALSRALPEAILITHADAHTFTLWYYRLAEGRRPDVSIVDARLASYDWYGLMLVAQDATLRLPDDRGTADLADRLLVANPARPVCEVAESTGELTCQSPDATGD